MNAISSAVLGGVTDSLQDLFSDPNVKEIVVNNDTEVWVERTSGLQRACDLSPGEAAALLERLLAPMGRRIDLASPVVDARLADGSRLCAAIPPVSPHGLAMAIRRFGHAPLTLGAFGSARTADLLESAVLRRRNIIVSGATSSGKTTLLGALASHVPPTERILVLEDTNELVLRHPHAVYLEARPATAEGMNEVTLSDLVRHALRLRPDRLVVGEVRGPEAFDMLQAMNTGHTGSLSSCHANSARDALHRIESMVLQSIGNWPHHAVRAYVASAIDMVVHLERDADGSRRITDVVEVSDILGSSGDFVVESFDGVGG
jgi:pilus assembly protein CpaF